MKCQNCGNSEVNFHYSSIVNGCVTETHLCSECAAKSGFDIESFFNTENVFQGFLPILGRMDGYMPTPAMWLDPFPFAAGFRPGLPAQGACDCGCEKVTPNAPATEVDEEMKKRREMNLLREQMRLAAESDDFEKAIELREKIKEMEC